MINKITNWTIGSFFRTIGRIIAYTLIGCGFGLLINKLGLFDLSSILFMKVNASVLPYNSAYLNANQCELVYAYNDNLWYLRNCQWDSNNNIGNSITFGAQNGHLKKIEFNIKDSGDYEIGNYNLVFNWGIDPRNLTDWNNKYNIKVYGSRNNGNDIELTSNCSTSLGSGNYDFNTSCNFSTLEKFDHFKILYDFYGGQTCRSHINYGIACSDGSVMPVNTNAMSFNSITVFEYDNNSTTAINNQTTIINNSLNEVNTSINDLNESINDTTPPDLDEFDNIAGWLPAGPVDSILTLPLSILNSLTNALSTSTCPALHLPIPFIGGFIDIPCISTIFSNINGLTTFWETIGATLGGLILYKYFCSLYIWVDDITSLKHNHARLFGAVNEANAWGGAVDDV